MRARNRRQIETTVIAQKLWVIDLDWSSGHGDWGEKAYGFRICFGGRSDRTFASELGMRDKRVDKRSRVTPRFLA